MNIVSRALGALCIFSSTCVSAEEGVALRLTVIESTGAATHSYSTGVLMKLTESTAFDIPNHYGISIQSRELEEGKINLVLGLKDLSEGKAVYGGGGAVAIRVGENANVELKSLPSARSSYRMLIESSFAELPK